MKEQYFEKKLESPGRIDLEKDTLKETLSRIDTPIVEIHDFPEEGKWDFKKESFELSLSCDEAEFIPAMQRYRMDTLNKNELAKQWRTLKSYKFRSGEDKLDTTEILPDGWKVIFRPSSGYLGGAGTDDETKTILVDQDITKPVAILQLSHEAGHAQIMESMTDEERNFVLDTRKEFKEAGREQQEIEGDKIDRVIKDERDAWAFALRTIKPLIKSGILSLNDVRNFIHDIALKSYSNDVRSLIEKDLIKTKNNK